MARHTERKQSDLVDVGWGKKSLHARLEETETPVCRGQQVGFSIPPPSISHAAEEKQKICIDLIKGRKKAKNKNKKMDQRRDSLDLSRCCWTPTTRIRSGTCLIVNAAERRLPRASSPPSSERAVGRRREGADTEANYREAQTQHALGKMCIFFFNTGVVTRDS